MTRQAKDILIRVVILLVVHGLSLIIFYGDVTNYRIATLMLFIDRGPLLLLFGLLPILIVAFIFGFTVHDRPVFAKNLMVVVAAWQIQFLLLDWIRGRFSVPWWNEEKFWFAREVFWRFIFPIALVSLGALCSWLKRRFLFVAHSRHA